MFSQTEEEAYEENVLAVRKAKEDWRAKVDTHSHAHFLPTLPPPLLLTLPSEAPLFVRATPRVLCVQVVVDDTVFRIYRAGEGRKKPSTLDFIVPILHDPAARAGLKFRTTMKSLSLSLSLSPSSYSLPEPR